MSDAFRGPTDFAVAENLPLNHKKHGEALAHAVADIRKVSQIHREQAPKITKRGSEGDEGAILSGNLEVREVNTVKGAGEAVNRIVIVIADALFRGKNGLGLGCFYLPTIEPLPKMCLHATLREMIHLLHCINFHVVPPIIEISSVVSTQRIIDCERIPNKLVPS